jgi:hypothetical protein
MMGAFAICLLALSLPSSALELGIKAGGASVGVGVGRDGIKADADAGGVKAGASVGRDGVGIGAHVGPGDGISADIEAPGLDVDVGIGGGAGAPGPGAPPPGTPPGTPPSGPPPSTLRERVGGASDSEKAVLRKFCPAVLASPITWPQEVVLVCRVVQDVLGPLSQNYSVNRLELAPLMATLFSELLRPSPLPAGDRRDRGE